MRTHGPRASYARERRSRRQSRAGCLRSISECEALRSAKRCGTRLRHAEARSEVATLRLVGPLSSRQCIRARLSHSADTGGSIPIPRQGKFVLVSRVTWSTQSFHHLRCPPLLKLF